MFLFSMRLFLLVVWCSVFSEMRGEIVSVEALRPASPREEGSPLFRKMGAEETGIDFENRFDHPRRWLELWKQYFNGSIGTGVALGDVNGDGWPDLFAVGKDSPNGLYLNKGDFIFEDATDAAGVAGGKGFGTGAALVDIDNDGDLDLYVCYVAGANELYVNDGGGRFEERAAEWGLDFEAGSNAPSFADYDRDGDLDLYLQQNYLHDAGHLDGMPDHLFRNDGGVFVDVTQEAGISGEGQGHTALWWDYDEDGWLDIYVSNDFEPVDKLYRNNQDGTFSDVLRDVLGSAPYSAMGVDSGDLNNDGHIDILVAEMLARDREYYHQAVGPLSGKLLAARRSGVNQYMQNMLWASLGQGRFVELGRYAGLHASDWTWATRFADLDNDGWLDAFFANGMTRAFHDGDLAYKMTKARSLATRVKVFETSPPLYERNLAYRNLGDFQFEDVSADWGLDALSVSFAAAFADLDLDGDLDLVTSNWKEGLGVFRNQSQSGQRFVLKLEGRESNRMGLGAKAFLGSLSGVQTRELSSMRGYMSVDEPVLQFALQEGEEIESFEIQWPSGAKQMLEGLKMGNRYVVREVLSIDGEARGERSLFSESKIAIDEESYSSEEVFAARKGQFLLPFAEDRLGPVLEVADLDGDGFEDIILGGATGQELRVFRNEGGARLRFVRNRAFEDDDLCEDTAIVPFDFDQDGDLDLFVASGGVELDEGDEYYADRLYLNLGDMQFSETVWRGTSIASSSAVLVEGELLFVSGGTKRGWYPQVEANRCYEVGGESVLSEIEHRFAQSGRTSRLFAFDLDWDGDEDLVQLREYASPFAWRWEDGELEEWPELFAGIGNGMWKSAAVADFDENGLLDIALGNLGTNNKYLVRGDGEDVLFAPRSEEVKGRFIEAETIGGKLYPRESRIFHQVNFPDIAKRTGLYSEFKHMTVEEAFGDEVLERYEQFVIEERESVLLLQTKMGEFERAELPAMAQSGVAIDLLAEDFNGDGRPDLSMVLESLSPQPAAVIHPESSRVLVLMNTGAGGFSVKVSLEAGLNISKGEPRQLRWGDFDGDGVNELAVSSNEGPLYLFEGVE
ncbi:VCBS repeat-containing protein [Pelagicoccus mobilis]|uniref:VCBS repeat-containing protein n=1 Tax=Pelagicoccus mobilis TaxID=415221 RepID=A0A934VPH8_9BACT|nr:VCBS repeat-containing protein [Pelagicoccus mobilis]MBK1875543.1 VCBS repeat-containing protein [Pelagicoccus mobilis]